MQRLQHLRALEREGALLADALATTTWDSSVPGCPGWVARDLVLHVGRVQRWATSFVRDRVTGRTSPDGVPAPGVDDELLAWFREGHATAVRVLGDAPGDVDCWRFMAQLPLSPVEFWTRRQAHEAAIHRVDAEQAATLPVTPFDAEFAVDGIEELLTGFLGQPRRRGGLDGTLTVLLRATDTGDAWHVTTSAGEHMVTRADAAAPVTVAGTASDLHLALWNRGDVVTVDGDADAWRRWREATAI